MKAVLGEAMNQRDQSAGSCPRAETLLEKAAPAFSAYIVQFPRTA